jgi:hypothetical protein
VPSDAREPQACRPPSTRLTPQGGTTREHPRSALPNSEGDGLTTARDGLGPRDS